MTLSNPPRVFISYARDDDEPFVKRLYEDLTHEGVDVWWDRESMPNRALTFLQEIRDAIDDYGRVLLVIGPSAVESDYVNAEWQYAIEACLGVNPVLRLGEDYSLVPPELSALHCVDMRANRDYEEALNELLNILAQPVSRPSTLHNVPSLPTHFQRRNQYIHALRDHLLADVNRPVVITSAQRVAALQGMGGIGKSALAADFARACDVRRAFADGIVWLTLGQAPDVYAQIRAAGVALDDAPNKYVDEATARARLAEVLQDKVTLIMLDDVWEVHHIDAFRNALGPRCRLLITTRDARISASLEAQDLSLDVLDEGTALQLLAGWAAITVEALPPEAHEVAKECGNLPLALAVSGAMARGGNQWLDILAALREADLNFIKQALPNYEHSNVYTALHASVNALERKSSDDAFRYLELVVFPSETLVKASAPEAAIVTLWTCGTGLKERDARELLGRLSSLSLLRAEGQSPQRTISLHDLQHDYLRARTSDQLDLAQLHADLLDAYQQKCPDGWASGPDDGYFFQNLPYHLVQAGRADDLRQLLLDYRWVRTKLNATGALALLADYDLLGKRLSDADPQASALREVARALRHASHTLIEHPDQLASQLWGRLDATKNPVIERLLESARKAQPGVWLRPMKPSLGGETYRTINAMKQELERQVSREKSEAPNHATHNSLVLDELGKELERLIKEERSQKDPHVPAPHKEAVNSIAVTADGQHAISVTDNSDDIVVWDMQTGQPLPFRTKQSDSYTIVLTCDDSFAVVISNDGSLTQWDTQTVQPLHTLLNRTDIFVRATGEEVTLYGPLASSSVNMMLIMQSLTLIVRDESNSLTLCTFVNDHSLSACAISADGRTIVAGDNGGRVHFLHLENLDSALTQ